MLNTQKTNWDNYYEQPAGTAPFTRKITENKILNLFKTEYKGSLSEAIIVEMGGANSCFYDAVKEHIGPKKYHIMDNNEVGLNKFRQRCNDVNVTVENIDLLNASSDHFSTKGDIVYSVGLIEHFDKEGTAKMIKSHFEAVKSGGLVLVTFPTPTWLYNLTRGIISALGKWIFHDERPLTTEEVLTEMQKHGTILHQSITWPIFLTQGVIVARKK